MLLLKMIRGRILAKIKPNSTDMLKLLATNGDVVGKTAEFSHESRV